MTSTMTSIATLPSFLPPRSHSFLIHTPSHLPPTLTLFFLPPSHCFPYTLPHDTTTPLLLPQAGDPTVSYRLLYGCNKAGAAEEVLLDPATNVRTVTHLLPQCEYWLVVGWTSGQSVVLSEECNVTTPNGQSEQFPPQPTSFSPFSFPLLSLFPLHPPSLLPISSLPLFSSPSPPPSSVSPKG